MADNAGLAAALDGIPMVADAAARDARFPLSTRKQNQRVQRLDTLTVERWTGSAWHTDVDGARIVTGLNVRAFGALADGSVDDALGINAAIVAAQLAYEAGITYSAKVYLPAGHYYLDTPVIVPTTSTNSRGVAMVGDGMRQTTLRVRTAMTAAVVLNSNTAYGSAYNTLVGFTVDGAALASYALYGSRVSNSIVRDVRATGATTAGASIGYGWTNTYLACSWDNNNGDGFIANEDQAQSNNAMVFVGCTSVANTGVGYRLRAGLGISFVGGDIEQCAKGGIFVTRSVNGLSIDGTYFEGNGGAGLTLSSVTYKSHILLNGETVETTRGDTFPSTGVGIRNCLFSTHGVEDAVVVATGVKGLDISGCSATVAAGSAVPLLKAFPTTKLTDVTIEGNQGFSTDVVPASLPTASETGFRRWRVASVPQQHYAEPDFLRWSLQVANSGSGGTFKRSSTTFRGQPVWEIATAGAGTTDTYGFTIDVTNAYPQLASQTVVFGAWVKQTDTSIGAALYAGGNLTASGAVTNAGWRWTEVAVTLPASGSTIFGVLGFVMGAAKSVYITEPTLVGLGSPMETMYRVAHSRVWSGTAAPTTGTWVVGDRVVNRVPTVGQPKAWSCTVAGAPGTWVSEGNL